MPANVTRRFGQSLCLLAGLVVTAPALAWGPQGHALIADIAAAHLTPTARHEIGQLLALDHQHHLDEVASWPDAIRAERPATGPWHYVDIPLYADQYQAHRDCPNGRCVVARITRFAAVLGDRSAAPARRLEALKFVVHFVADVQQPLHAEDHDDKGGNDVKLAYFGRRTNLHAVWDSAILDRALGLTVRRDYSFDYGPTRNAANRLDADITAHERDTWGRDVDPAHLDRAVVRWANQAHRLARTVAYADLPPAPRRDWSQAYQRRTWPVVRRQIQRGGVRLAAVLNTELTH